MFPAEQEFVLDQEQLVSIIQEAEANILLVTEKYNIITINDALVRFFLNKYQITLSPGHSFINELERNYSDLALEWEKRFDKALLGENFKLEDVIEINGHIHYWELHFHAFPLSDEKMGISVLMRDITLRKKYEAGLVKNEANVRSILNTTDDGIWLINRRFELIDFNQKFFEKYKIAFNTKLVRGKNIIDLIPEEHGALKSLWSQRYLSAMKGKGEKFYDTYQVGPEIFTYEITTYPIREKGKVTGVTIFSRDITEQKKIEQQLTLQNEELQKVNSEMDRFVYSASHDLRAPLLSVKGLVSLIRMEPNHENHQLYLNKIDNTIDKLDSFIKDIIDYSMNSRSEVAGESIDFNKLLTESVESLKYTEEAEKVRLDTDILQCNDFTSDKRRLLIIFNNIISNAVRYQDRYKESFLKVSIRCTGKSAQIEFSDNGIGIGSEYLDRIFGMFFRANNERTGSGLGLYIVKETVTMLKGNVSVASKLGEGTTFRIEIPHLAKTEN